MFDCLTRPPRWLIPSAIHFNGWPFGRPCENQQSLEIEKKEMQKIESTAISLQKGESVSKQTLSYHSHMQQCNKSNKTAKLKNLTFCWKMWGLSMQQSKVDFFSKRPVSSRKMHLKFYISYIELSHCHRCPPSSTSPLHKEQGIKTIQDNLIVWIPCGTFPVAMVLPLGCPRWSTSVFFPLLAFHPPLRISFVLWCKSGLVHIVSAVRC